MRGEISEPFIPVGLARRGRGRNYLVVSYGGRQGKGKGAAMRNAKPVEWRR